MSSFLLFSKQFLRSKILNNLQIKSKAFGFRYLFTKEVLGIDGYLQTRDRISNQFNQMRDKFFQRMEDHSKTESKMIFTEDLKNIIFLTENNGQELQLMSDSIKKFHSQNQSLQFGTFVFGPIVMRLLHHLSDWELALNLFKDPQLKGFFSQIKSVVILMNILFINGKYEEVMDVFYHMQNELQFETKYPRDCVLLYMAAAYKMNTEEALDRALEVLKNSREAGALVTRKTICLFAGLALNQNQPNIALEVLSSITQTNYISVRNLRLIALSDLKRFDDLFITLKVILSRDVPPEGRRPEVLEETLKKIKEKVDSIDDKQIESEFIQIERGLIEGNHIQAMPIETILLTPIEPRSDPNPRDGQQRGFRNPYNEQNFRRYDRRDRRQTNEEF